MGAWSVSLAIGATNGLLLATVLWLAKGHVVANRTLAVLVGLVALRLIPYVLGYAGYYDLHPWLTFLPFDLSFAYGPLLWCYVRLLTTGNAPKRWPLHLIPVGLQTAYWCVCFALPVDEKWSWYTGTHLKVIAPLGAAAALVSATVYLVASIRTIHAYKTWLDNAFANKDDARLRGLHLLLLANATTIAVAAAFAMTSWFVAPLDYFARFPLMVVFALLTYAMGVLGWRNASVEYPIRTEIPSARDAETPSLEPEPSVTPEPYREQAEAWRLRVIEAGWWRDETLDLAGLALKLATSERTLSRTLSEGLNQNFREFLGRIRADAVATVLADANNKDPILDVAFAAGFNSKASFNRMFLQHFGVTPSAYRTAQAAERLKSRQSLEKAAFGATSDPG